MAVLFQVDQIISSWVSNKQFKFAPLANSTDGFGIREDVSQPGLVKFQTVGFGRQFQRPLSCLAE